MPQGFFQVAVGAEAGDVQHQIADTHVLVLADVAGNLVAASGEPHALAAGIDTGDPVVVAAINYLDFVRIATRCLGGAPQSVHPTLQGLGCAHRECRVVADGIPAVAKGGSSADGRPALATHPKRRVRLLHRLGQEPDIREADVLALKCGVVSRPKLLEGPDVLVGNGAAFVEGFAAHCLKLLAAPADTHANDQAATRQHIERRQGFGGDQRVSVGNDDYRRGQPDFLGAAGHVRQGGDLLHGLAGCGTGKLARFGVGVIGRDAAGHQDVVAQRDGIEPQRLAFLGDGGHVVGGGKRAAAREGKSVLHNWHSYWCYPVSGKAGRRSRCTPAR